MTTQINQQVLDDCIGKVLGDLTGSCGGVMVSLGEKLGLYKAMRGAGPLTSGELAKRAGCAERYVREWLNSQAAAGGQQPRSSCTGGHLTLPNEQNTQQSPANGRSNARQPLHS